MCLASSFKKSGGVFLRIAFNNGGVQSFWFHLSENPMALLQGASNITFQEIRWRVYGLRLTSEACNVCWFRLSKNTMAFLWIALNKCGVQCVWPRLTINPMAFLRIACNSGCVQYVWP